MSIRRERFTVRGQVQGVGFRPFVFSLAEEFGLAGFVRNSPHGVAIEVQGPEPELNAFAHALETRLPPLARLTAINREQREPLPGEKNFIIAHSTAGREHAVLISPDTATCADCLADINAPSGRRYRYAFTNCTNCGPRYTITRSIPYDRACTSMACFAMCPACRTEYENPRDRRFHAQPNACPECGPQIWFVENRPDKACPHPLQSKEAAAPPREVPNEGTGPGRHPEGEEALRALALFLLSGGIAAIKGLGGFHLACDALNHKAVERLRLRKNRPHKPFALMAANLAAARRIAKISEAEEKLLLSPERPIVICPLSETGKSALSPAVSPDTGNVGLMLPYTPLHFALFNHLSEHGNQDGFPPPLIMTSGNPGGEPICLGNREAADHLGGMAEAFLFHNRDILIRVDDSVARPLPGGGTLFLRRARGYVPRPSPLPERQAPPGPSMELRGPGGTAENPPVHYGQPERTSTNQGPSYAPASPATGVACVLGVGAELKNTLCLTKNGDAFVSQHIGDMSNLETAAFHASMRDHLAGLLQVRPQAIIRDLHPDYLSSAMAEELGKELDLPVYTLQHHFAHAHAVLAENRFMGKALVFTLDGTGLGEDGTLWGGELLLLHTRPGSAPVHARLARFAPLDLPGGEAAIREPWRIAHALLLRLGLDKGPLPWLPEYEHTAALLPLMLERRINTPRSSSCGRLFDAVSALLGLCNATSYEGQAAIRLEEAQYQKHEAFPPEEDTLYPCPFGPQQTEAGSPCLELDTHALFAAARADVLRGLPASRISRCFHHSLAAGLAKLAAHLARKHGVHHVGLSGGCLQNISLTARLSRELERYGLIPLLHKELPPGDGCISLGQAAWGDMVFSPAPARQGTSNDSTVLQQVEINRHNHEL